MCSNILSIIIYPGHFQIHIDVEVLNIRQLYSFWLHHKVHYLEPILDSILIHTFLLSRSFSSQLKTNFILLDAFSNICVCCLLGTLNYISVCPSKWEIAQSSHIKTEQKKIHCENCEFELIAVQLFDDGVGLIMWSFFEFPNKTKWNWVKFFFMASTNRFLVSIADGKLHWSRHEERRA